MCSSDLRQAVRNSEQATNLIQTAEGSLNEVNAILIRMRELAVQSASSTVNDDNRGSINAEFVQLSNEIDRISTVTAYNNSTLLTGFGNNTNKDVTVSTALDSAAIRVFNAAFPAAKPILFSILCSSARRASFSRLFSIRLKTNCSSHGSAGVPKFCSSQPAHQRPP